ncbi:deoxyribodipyrimidine photolyase [Mycoplasmatota bacterium]|nr:deoxyribodipyrimidine photolyase [Mycoplasmatota bacterium]
MSNRNIVVLDNHNDKDKVIYLMNKSFRVNNNYTLYQAMKYCEEFHKDLWIVMVEPYEINSRNLDYFYQYSEDLYEKLHQFTDQVKIIKRDYDYNKLLEDTHAVFIDKSYLKFDLSILNQIKKIAIKKEVLIIEVESNVFVPITVASDKEEYAARTIRRKINDKLSSYKDEVLNEYLSSKAEKEAIDCLKDFIDHKLSRYDEHNDPSKNLTSGLSPFLKYGFISPVTIYNMMETINDNNKEDFLEELIVRRELAYNFVYYNQSYDEFEGMTDQWAYQTMKNHMDDQRDYIYSMDDYIHFRTHDPYFNACMIEMVYLGKMHSYMRMYWAKKIIEWSKTYEEAYKITLDLNNRYFYDGLTPNGYTGVAWCYGKHDRAWFERDIFGKLRYMNDNGLKRKFNIDTYVEDMNNIKGGSE